MTDAELIETSLEFRKGIIGEMGTAHGMCFAIAAALEGFLGFSGTECELVESDHSNLPESPWKAHFWLKLSDGRALDPTFDQLVDGAPPIYLGEPTKFHVIGEGK